MIKLVIPLLLAAALAGCSESGFLEDGTSGGGGTTPQEALRCTDATASNPSLGTPFNMRAGAQTTITAEELELTFEQLVQDTRCPTGVQCPNAGQADVVVEIQESGHGAGRLALSTDSVPASEGSYRHWDVQLVGVTPYPEFGRPATDPADYCVQLTVVRRN